MSLAWAHVWGVWGILLQLWVVQSRMGRRLRPTGFATAAAMRLVALYIVVGAALWVAYRSAGLSLDEHAAIAWAVVAAAAAVGGADIAMRFRRPVGAELAFAGLAIMQLAVAVTFAPGGTNPAALRALIVLPATLALSGTFGASLGLLLAPGTGGGHVNVRLGYEVAVGRRFLLARSSQVLSVVTSISVMGVSLGVWLVLVSLGILSGFEDDLTEKLIGANAHVTLQPIDHVPFAGDDALAGRLVSVPGVAAVAAVLEAEVAVSSTSNYAGAQLFGIDPAKSPAALRVLRQLVAGSLAPLMGEAVAPVRGMGHVVMGVEMARSLNVRVGDRVRIISPALEVLTPLGTVPKSAGFEVAAIFSAKMYEFDARYLFVTLPVARHFLELAAPTVSGYQLACTQPARAPEVGSQALRVASAHAREHSARLPPLEALDWKRRNQTLFSALKLERVVATIVLAFIILVASFSIVNTLTMSAIAKRRDIAILKTMGAYDASIAKIFLVQGMLVGGLGTTIGTCAGLATMLALSRLGFWIPRDVYYIDALPVRLGGQDVALVVAAALVIIWDFAAFPAYRGAQLSPVEGLRDG